jgi:hypothetical protein
MEALVVYESMFGNTRRIAEAVAAGLGESMGVTLGGVEDAPTAPGEGVGLLVLGGPTHAFSMSRAGTRADAHDKGAPGTAESGGLREWVAGLPSGPHPTLVATFDTRVLKVRHLPGSAARAAAKAVRRHGYHLVLPPESFYVLDVDGPLADDEVRRAERWGLQLAQAALVATG